MNEQNETHEKSIITAYKPSELIAIFSAALGRQNEFAKLVSLRGIYQQRQNNQNWSFAYAGLRDENTQEEITLRMPKELYESLTNGNLITVIGILERKIDPRASVQITLNVTRVEKLQEQAVSEADQKKAELRRRKAQTGFRNVDGVIEQRLLADERPKVALLLANNSITLSDFEAGIQAARAAIDFTEYRCDFFKAGPLCQNLNDIDSKGFDVIAVVRGGGIGIERLDNLEVLETLAHLTTPVISAVGHPEERLAFKEIADKEVATPTALGQYLSDMVERVAGMKAKSKAMLVQQVSKQYADQIANLEKRLTKQEKDFKDERAGYVEREKRNVEEMANLKNKVAWMANKLNERKRTIVWLAVGLAIVAGVLIWVLAR
ncbi:MAG: exonuclease VII large subunit [Bacteroidales bacterium]|nr:exonuclease VII large subunit [Bacteroidales bacterium]